MSDTFNSLRQRADDFIGQLPGPVPAKVLTNFLLGTLDPKTGMPTAPETPGAFTYSPQKVAAILDIAEANIQIVKQLPTPKQAELIANGGGPGVGKTTALFRQLAKEFGIRGLTAKDWGAPSLHKAVTKLFLQPGGAPAALVAQDRKELLQLALQDHGTPTSDLPFYLGNRSATNFLALTNMNAGFAHDKNIVWDTTLSSPGAVVNLQYAKDNGRRISTILCGAPYETREEAANTRNSVYYQSLPMNLTAQEQGFRDTLPKIMKLTDHILVGWRDRADQPTKIVAVVQPQEGRAIVLDKGGLNRFTEHYQQAGIQDFEKVSARRHAVVPRLSLPVSSL